MEPRRQQQQQQQQQRSSSWPHIRRPASASTLVTALAAAPIDGQASPAEIRPA